MLNAITIMGRLVRAPELRRTGSGVAVTSFCIACDRDIQNNGQKEVDFIDCVAWRQTAEFVEKYFAKGQMVTITGRLQIRTWEDKSGNKRRTAEILADHVYFCGSKNSEESAGTREHGSYARPAPAHPSIQSAEDYGLLDEDDAQLPF